MLHSLYIAHGILGYEDAIKCKTNHTKYWTTLSQVRFWACFSRFSAIIEEIDRIRNEKTGEG